jgi:type IV fimbrial biogenesis protein FimT
MRRLSLPSNNYRRMFSQMASHASEQGFSIFDLLTAIAIIAILATIALPSMTQEMAKYRLNGAARQLAGELMAARMRAVAQNRSVKVSFPDDQVYKVCDAICEGDPKVVNIRDSYKDITIKSGNDIIFNQRGSSSTFGTIYVSNGKGTKSIVVAITGRVKIN